MKGFYIEITNNLLESKHYKNMGEAIWLYMWFLDRMTSVSESGIGKVLNGSVITHAIVTQDLPMSRSTYTRYVSRLKQSGYIKVSQTQTGLIVSITKAKKTFGRSVKNDAPKINRSGASNMTQQMRQNRTSDASNMTRVYKETYIQNNNTDNNNVDLQKQVRLVYSFFIQQFNKNPNKYKLSKQRVLKIKARLKDAGEEMLMSAIQNTASSGWHRGDNDRGWEADLDFIIRSYEQVEKLANMGSKAAVNGAIPLTEEEKRKYA